MHADDPISAVLGREYVRIGDASFQRVGRIGDTLICVADVARVRFENPSQRLYERDERGVSHHEREGKTAFVDLHPGAAPLIRKDSVLLPIADISQVRVFAAQPGNMGTGTIILFSTLLLLTAMLLTVDYRMRLELE
jgi:hypothetical protein